jgi:hypothetical protein
MGAGVGGIGVLVSVGNGVAVGFGVAVLVDKGVFVGAGVAVALSGAAAQAKTNKAMNIINKTFVNLLLYFIILSSVNIWKFFISNHHLSTMTNI